MEELFCWLKFFAMIKPQNIEAESLFIALCPDGSGWVADGLDVHYEFNTPGDGTVWIRDQISRHLRKVDELQATNTGATKTAIGLLNSMVEAGERHTDESRRVVAKALDVLTQ